MRSVYNLFVCILLVLPIVLSACGDSEEPKTVIEDDGMIWTSQEGYFVQGYVDVEQLAVEACSGYAKVGCLGLAVDCDRVDNPFDRNYKGPFIPYGTNFSVLNAFQKMKLVSDSDFDEQHKARMPLADIVMFVGASPYDFIAGGYRNAYKWDETEIEFYKKGVYTYKSGYAPVYRVLSEMDASDYRLIHPGFCLVFLTQPTLNKTHNLTLTVTDGKWKNWEVTWRQQFGE